MAPRVPATQEVAGEEVGQVEPGNQAVPGGGHRAADLVLVWALTLAVAPGIPAYSENEAAPSRTDCHFPAQDTPLLWAPRCW